MTCTRLADLRLARERYTGIFNFTRKSCTCSLRKYYRHEDENSTKVTQ